MELTLSRSTRAQRAEMSRQSAPSSLGKPRSAGWPREFGKSSYITIKKKKSQLILPQVSKI